MPYSSILMNFVQFLKRYTYEDTLLLIHFPVDWPYGEMPRFPLTSNSVITTLKMEFLPMAYPPFYKTRKAISGWERKTV